MSKYLRICLWISCCLLGCTSMAKAQDEASGKRYRVTLFNTWKGPELFVKTKKSYVRLEAHKMAYTKPFRYSSGEPIVFYSKVVSGDGEEKYKAFLRIQVPAGTLEPLLVLYWNTQDKKAGAKIVEFSPQRFRYGSYQLVNLSSTKIFGYIGDKKKRFSCNPGTEYISPTYFRNGARTPIVAYVEEASKPSLVYSTMTIHRERKRVILFLNAERNKLKRVVYRSQSLVDFRHSDE